jgi:cytidylate kinase
MENIFKTYFEQQFREQQSRPSGTPKPVVTISREFGCPSKLIALMLEDSLNKREKEKKEPAWKFINKEVVEEAAHKLDIKMIDMNSALSYSEKGLMKDILKSFSPPYINSFKIKKTLFDVIRSFALQGKMIIVGRGGAAILQDRPSTLHVKLMAPVDWRVRKISASKGITEAEALKMILEMDKKRSSLIELLLDRKPDPSLFDVVFNCSTLSREEVVHTLVSMMEARKMI